MLQTVHIWDSQSCRTVDKLDKAMPTDVHIVAALSPATTFGRSTGSVDSRIRAFLNGESHGEDVLGALYGHVAGEPIPKRLVALLRR